MEVATKNSNMNVLDTYILNEGAIFSQLSHPNIVPFLSYMVDENSFSLISELMEGDLQVVIDSRMHEDGNRDSPFSILEACDIMLQVAEGMHYMHQNKVVHRDLTPSNILVRSSKGYNSVYWCSKVYIRCSLLLGLKLF
nr:light-sensor Protein kinase-like [Physcomitrium patens]|eukprot:XP_024403870.1 light-sensor Protein kinase-like [Physcomitrella patens]